MVFVSAFQIFVSAIVAELVIMLMPRVGVDPPQKTDVEEARRQSDDFVRSKRGAQEQGFGLFAEHRDQTAGHVKNRCDPGIQGEGF